MLYLGWVDDTPRKTVAGKIREGAAAYEARFGAPPTICVCSAANVAAVGGQVDGIAVGTAVDTLPQVSALNLFLLGRVDAPHDDYRQACGAIRSTGGVPAEVPPVTPIEDLEEESQRLIEKEAEAAA